MMARARHGGAVPDPQDRPSRAHRVKPGSRSGLLTMEGGRNPLAEYVGISSSALIGDLPTCPDKPITWRPITLPFSSRGTRPIAATTVSVHEVKSDGMARGSSAVRSACQRAEARQIRFRISPISDSHRALRLGQVYPTGHPPDRLQRPSRVTHGAFQERGSPST
jgi:hypothetical protein